MHRTPVLHWRMTARLEKARELHLTGAALRVAGAAHHVAGAARCVGIATPRIAEAMRWGVVRGVPPSEALTQAQAQHGSCNEHA